MKPLGSLRCVGMRLLNTVVPGFRVLGFRALKAGNGAWSVHKTLFGFRAPLSALYLENFRFLLQKAYFLLQKAYFLLKKLTFVGVWIFFTAKKLTFGWFEFQSPLKASGLHI